MPGGEMVNLGITVAGEKGTKSIQGQNAYLRDVLHYKQEDRATQLGRVEGTIQLWNTEDSGQRTTLRAARLHQENRERESPYKARGCG